MSSDAAPTLGRPVVLVVMGVSGCGKSTIAALLAGWLGWAFEEGDALHPQANIEKMTSGHRLTDDDRRPWLRRVAAWIDERLDAGENGIITCSALKRAYRDVLDHRGFGVVFVYLAGDGNTISDRMAVRQGHFMPTGLLESQFADLEEPAPDEPAIRVDIGAAPPELAHEIRERLAL
jgi:gluconokinase